MTAICGLDACVNGISSSRKEKTCLLHLLQILKSMTKLQFTPNQNIIRATKTKHNQSDPKRASPTH